MPAVKLGGLNGRKAPGSPALVSLPARGTTPARELGRRGLFALALLALCVALVYFDRGAYGDPAGDGTVGFVDALYYATITMTATGYGDITPVAPRARLVTAVIITPLRVVFLALLVGTTVEVLASEGQRRIRDRYWRKRMRNHIVVIGYGTKGRSAVQILRENDVDPAQVVVLDGRAAQVAEANLAGLAAIEGDATAREVLRRAEVSKARQVIITLDRDDSAILVTLTVRQLNPRAYIVVAAREDANTALLRQSGANNVITSSDSVGRLLGISAVNPNLGSVIEDLLTVGEGLEIAERQVTPEEVGANPSEIRGERVVAVVRNKTLRRFYDPSVAALDIGDQLVVVRRAPEDAYRQAGDGRSASPTRSRRANL